MASKEGEGEATMAAQADSRDPEALTVPVWTLLSSSPGRSGRPVLPGACRSARGEGGGGTADGGDRGDASAGTTLADPTADAAAPGGDAGEGRIAAPSLDRGGGKTAPDTGTGGAGDEEETDNDNDNGNGNDNDNDNDNDNNNDNNLKNNTNNKNGDGDGDGDGNGDGGDSEGAAGREGKFLDLGLPEDAFSMLYVAATPGEHALPLFTFAVQMLIICLISYNLIDGKASLLDPTMNIPVGVPVEVTVAKFVACVLSPIMAQDFADGVFFARKRVAPGGYLPLGRKDPRPPISAKWELTNALRALEGAATVWVSFVFIVQSATVIDLFLNFAAVAFVSTLDDMCFQMAIRGLIGIGPRRSAEKVVACKVWSRGGHLKLKTTRITAFAAAVGGICAGVAVFAAKQDGVHYACKSVHVAIGEDSADYFWRFSGTYSINEAPHSGRAVYFQEHGGLKYLAYCNNYRRWTLSWVHPGQEEGWHPCYDTHLQSEKTVTYDITEINELQASHGDVLDGEIKCKDCSMNHPYESCGWRGECSKETANVGKFEYLKKTCECKEGFFGDSCQFIGPCTEMMFDGAGFPGYDTSFHLLRYEDRPLFIFDRPAYMQRNLADSGQSAALVFDGGRWLVIKANRFLDWTPEEKSIEEYLEQDFDNCWSDIDVDYRSELTQDKGSPGNVPFHPVFLGPDRIPSPGEDDYVLRCADCLSEHELNWQRDWPHSKCMNRSGYVDDSLCQNKWSDSQQDMVPRCACERGFIGPLCETWPVEGKLLLHLEHGAASYCSVCSKYNAFISWDLTGLENQTCFPFPKEPLFFAEDNDTLSSRQLGLSLNDTHFSVFVSSSQSIFSKSLCSIGGGSREIYSMKRDEKPQHQVHHDYAVLLDNETDFFGEIVDPGDIDCLLTSETRCDGSLSQVYDFDPLLQKSDLTRAWIQLDLKVTA